MLLFADDKQLSKAQSMEEVGDEGMYDMSKSPSFQNNILTTHVIRCKLRQMVDHLTPAGLG